MDSVCSQKLFCGIHNNKITLKTKYLGLNFLKLKIMEIQLENLSVEDLKTLRTNINFLLKDKCEPKYKEDTYFINSEDLFFIRICYSDYYVDGNLFYRIEINESDGNTIFRNVEESFIDKCLLISKEIYTSLLDCKDKLIDKLFDFKCKQDAETFNYKESLTNEFKDKLQEVINEYKND